MWILIVILIGVALFGLVAGYFYNRNIQKKIDRGELEEAPPVVTVDSECCGQHQICEKESLLAAVSKQIEYYDDEELDRCQGCRHGQERIFGRGNRRVPRHSVLHAGSGCGRMEPKSATSRH